MISLLLAAGALCASAVAVSSLAYSSRTAEAGAQVRASDFIKSGSPGAFFTEDSQAFDTSVPGTYNVKVKSGPFTHRAKLYVLDSVSPLAQGVTLWLPPGETCSPEDLTTGVSDITAVKTAFVSEPDFSSAGSQTVAVSVTDAGGNSTVVESKLIISRVRESLSWRAGGDAPQPVDFLLYGSGAEFVTDVSALDMDALGDYEVVIAADGAEFTSLLRLEDREPPRIEGVRDMTVLVGESLAYRKGVRVTDDFPEGLRLDVDSGGVDLNSEGEYTAVYTATDRAGNRTSVPIKVTVLQWEHSEEELNALADAVLQRILNDDMTPEQKVNAIYNYISTKILYVDHSMKGNWSQAAYEGLTAFKGDCFTFASTAKLLLTRAGIENMDISRSDQYGVHCWNLVDIGGGWYHFDSSPRADNPRIVLWTDEKLMAYSDSHGRHSYEYDKTKYPDIN